MAEPEVSSSAESAEENVTMVDVLQEQIECDADANAVLGASDPVNCTYANVSFVKSFVRGNFTVFVLLRSMPYKISDCK